MCAVALLTLIALIACFVQKNKGGKYAGTPLSSQRQDMFSMEKGQLVLVTRVGSPCHFALGSEPKLKFTVHIEAKSVWFGNIYFNNFSG